MLGPATEDARESSRSSANMDTFSLEVMDTNPLFLEKRIGMPPQEPAPKILSPKRKIHKRKKQMLSNKKPFSKIYYCKKKTILIY